MALHQKPLILNLETATEVCSVCLSQGGTVISLREAVKPNDHAKVINQLIEGCLSEARASFKDLDAVAISSGPGSYTSLRVGTSTAKGICYALSKPLIAVDTLQALALATWKKEQVEGYYCPMIDARRMEVYAAIFDHENKTIVGLEATILDENSFQKHLGTGEKIIFSGNGAQKCMRILVYPHALYSNVICSAEHMVGISNLIFQKEGWEDLAYFSPNYLKAPNITTPRIKVGA